METRPVEDPQTHPDRARLRMRPLKIRRRIGRRLLFKTVSSPREHGFNGFATEGGEIKTRYLYIFFSFDESNHYFI